MNLEKVAFVTHAIVETAASLSFIICPERQLRGCTPEAKLVLRQYGGLLLASSMVCLAVVAGSGCDSTTTRLLAAALGPYHVWPCYRALSRIRNEARLIPREPQVLGGAFTHLVVHVVCLGLFIYTTIAGA